MTLEFRAVSKRFGPVQALDALDLVVEEGSFTVLCGPPKSGKSTLFRILVGLEQADAGSVLIDGRDIAGDPPSRRPGRSTGASDGQSQRGEREGRVAGHRPFASLTGARFETGPA